MSGTAYCQSEAHHHKIAFVVSAIHTTTFPKDAHFGVVDKGQTRSGGRMKQYWGADKSLARPRRKKAQKHVWDARDFNNMETRTVTKVFFFLQGKAPKKINAILTETLACFLPGRAKDLSAPLYVLIGKTPLQSSLSFRLLSLVSVRFLFLI